MEKKQLNRGLILCKWQRSLDMSKRFLTTFRASFGGWRGINSLAVGMDMHCFTPDVAKYVHFGVAINSAFLSTTDNHVSTNWSSAKSDQPSSSSSSSKY